MPRIYRLMLVALAIGLGGLYFVHWSNTRALNSGAVHVRQQTADNAKSANPQPATADTADQPVPPQEVASNAGEQPHPQSETVGLPTSNSLGRRPSAGIAAVGKGRFELYRQGDLTFRLNTETGDACILLATQAQWSKNIVYSHGCNGR